MQTLNVFCNTPPVNRLSCPETRPTSPGYSNYNLTVILKVRQEKNF